MPTPLRRPEPNSNVCVVNVDPEVAAQWLSLNNHNRNPRRRKVDQYARDMAAGRWRWTGEPIQFDRNGRLINGQHRLAAIVKSDSTVPLLVVRDLDPEAQQQLDQGVSRTFNDVLRLRDEPDPNNLGALVRRVWEWKAGQRSTLESRGETSPSTTELLAVLDAHSELRMVAATAHQLAVKSDLTATTIGLLLWVFDQIDDDAAGTDALFFFERVADGQNLLDGDPIYALRRTLAALNADSRSKATQKYLSAITIKAWNAYREGRCATSEPMRQLYWRQGGAKPEPFPVPK